MRSEPTSVRAPTDNSNGTHHRPMRALLQLHPQDLAELWELPSRVPATSSLSYALSPGRVARSAEGARARSKCFHGPTFSFVPDQFDAGQKEPCADRVGFGVTAACRVEGCRPDQGSRPAAPGAPTRATATAGAVRVRQRARRPLALRRYSPARVRNQRELDNGLARAVARAEMLQGESARHDG